MIAERLDDELVEAAARAMWDVYRDSPDPEHEALRSTDWDEICRLAGQLHVSERIRTIPALGRAEARAALAAGLEIVAGRVEARAKPAAPNPDGTVTLEAMLQAKTNGVLKEAARIIRMDD